MYKDLQDLVISYFNLEKLSLKLLLSQNVAVTSLTLDLLAKHGYFHELKQLITKGHKPSRDSVNWAIQNGKVDIAIYLITLGIQISCNTYNLCAKYGSYDVLYHLFSISNKRPTMNIADTATINRHLEIVAYLKCHSIKPSSTVVDMACRNEHTDVVTYCHKYDIKPSKAGLEQAGLEQAIRFKHLKVVRFLILQKYEFTPLVIRFAEDNQIYDYLKKFNPKK